jgi:hypothetical protein
MFWKSRARYAPVYITICWYEHIGWQTWIGSETLIDWQAMIGWQGAELRLLAVSFNENDRLIKPFRKLEGQAI